MGASSFQIIREVNGNAEKTFRMAVDQAAYEYGHGGYTGTIAEKRFFVLYANCDTLAEAQQTVADFWANENKKGIDAEIDDKWGPAGAVTFKKDGKQFLMFFGWASC